MAAPWGTAAMMASQHVSTGVRGIFNYVSAKRQLESAKGMSQNTALVGLIDMTLQNQRQEAGVRAMRRTLGRIDEMYGASDDPKAQRSRRIIREMVGAAGQSAAAPRAEQATRSLGARRLALRRAAALGPGGSALQEQRRGSVRETMARDAATREARHQAEGDMRQGIEDQRIAARSQAVGLGGMRADVPAPYAAVRQMGAFDAAAAQEPVSQRYGIARSVQSGIENLIASYLEMQSRNQSREYQAPQWVEQEVGARLDPREGMLEDDGSLRDMGPLEPEGM